MPEPLTITVNCGPIDENGKRLVVVTYSKRSHTDRFDVDASYQRKKWREDAIKMLKLRGPYNPTSGSDDSESVHAELESKLQAAVDAAEESPAGGLWQPSVTAMANIEAKATHWLWEGYVPSGAITVIDGDPGLGKSQLTIDLAARVTRGDAMPPITAPDRTFTPRGVLMMNCEDDPARTLRPRLEAAGAVLSRVHSLRTMTALDGEEERLVCLPGDLQAIEAVVRQHDIGMGVLDPFVGFLDGKLSVNSDADVRKCLGQLAAVAESTGAAFVLVRHLNKKSGLSAVYRGGGSIGITGAARAAFMVGVDPVDPEQRIFCPVKTNLAIEPPSLRFSIKSFGDTSRVHWGEACDVSAHDICGHSKERGSGKTDKAKDILRELLAEGPRGSNEVLNACLSAGLSERTYHTARKALGVKSERTGFNDGQWLLTMPANGYHDAF